MLNLAFFSIILYDKIGAGGTTKNLNRSNSVEVFSFSGHCVRVFDCGHCVRVGNGAKTDHLQKYVFQCVYTDLVPSVIGYDV